MMKEAIRESVPETDPNGSKEEKGGRQRLEIRRVWGRGGCA